MKVTYDPEVDVLTVLLSDAPVAESDRPLVLAAREAMNNAAKHSGASTVETTSSVRYLPKVSRMNLLRNSTCSARRCNSASTRLRSDTSAQDPTISLGLPASSWVTVKVSWIQM